MEQKIEKNIFFFKIIAFELGVTNSCNIHQAISPWLSICKQTPLTFHLTLGETFSKSTSLKMMKKHDSSALIGISQVFGTF